MSGEWGVVSRCFSPLTTDNSLIYRIPYTRLIPENLAESADIIAGKAGIHFAVLAEFAVHQVVFRGDRREHAFDAAGFFIPAHILEPEGDLVFVHDPGSIGEGPSHGYMRSDARASRSRDRSSRTGPRHGR